MSCYIHETPGRLRVKTPSIKGKQHRGQEALNILSQIEGITNISVNTLTGSIVVNYDKDLTHSKPVLEVLSNAGFMKSSDSPRYGRVAKSSSKTREAVGRALFGWAVGRALQGTGFSFISAFI